MYDVALSVLSCLRADTAVHVAWVASGGDPEEAVAITPGGGRMGQLRDGALDHSITEGMRSLPDSGGLIDVSVGPVEALITGLAEGETMTIAVIPGSALPIETWEEIASRRPVAFSLVRAGSVLSHASLMAADDAFVSLSDTRLITSLVPTPKVVVSGGGPIADALQEAFTFIGWRASVVGDVGAASGMMATLSNQDAVIVMGHEVEIAGKRLQAAIGCGAGYIGSIGAPHMQGLRREWLAYRNVEWDDRVHGPAGLSIGASNAQEIAISIVAEAISVLQGTPTDPSDLD